jgi:hypothetical protein
LEPHALHYRAAARDQLSHELGAITQIIIMTSPLPLPRVTQRPFRYLLARVPLLPRSRLDAYRCHRALSLHRSARALAVALQNEGTALAERLAPLVPAADAGTRRALIEARRALYNVRPLPRGPWRTTLDAGAEAALSSWEQRLGELRGLRSARDQWFEREQKLGRSQLVVLSREQSFFAALALANPALAAKAAALPIEGPWCKRERQTVGRLMRYVLRAALKPVPHGLMAATAIVDLEASTAPCEALEERVSSVRLNRASFHRLHCALTTHPCLATIAQVHLTPCSYERDDTIWFLDVNLGEYRAASALEARIVRALIVAPRATGSLAALADGAQCSAADLFASIERGLLEIDFGLSDSEHNEGAVLRTRATQALPFDLSLLDAIDALHQLDETAARLPSLRGIDRLPVVMDLERHAARISGNSDGVPVAFEESGCAPIAVNRAELDPFLDSVARYGAGYLSPDPSPEDEVIAALFRLFSGGRTRMPFLEFHAHYATFARRHQLAASPRASAVALRRLCDLPATTIYTRFADEVDTFARAATNEIHLDPDLAALSHWRTAPRGRLSFRVLPTTAGRGGPRFHIAFWGADRMSLIPRYHAVPSPRAQPMMDAYRRWLSAWPALADAHGALGRNVDLRPLVTPRRVEVPGASPSTETIALRDLWLVADHDRGEQLRLVDNRGEAVDPVFFGVSAPHLLPPVTRLLLEIVPRPLSLLEAMLAGVNEWLARQLSAPLHDPLLILPIFLGDHIQLSPKMHVVPRASVPLPPSSVDRERFFALHDWLQEHALPSLAQIRCDARDPLWVDLDHPDGVDNFARHIADARLFFMTGPLTAQGVVESGTDHYEAELYIELLAEAGRNH